MFDIIIIGAGPAGLTAAIYAKRAAKKVLVLEGNTYGGQIINTLDIENYPAEEHISGFDFATKLYEQALHLGAEIKFERVLEITKDKEVKTKDSVYKAKSIIIAVGSKNKQLGLINEDDFVGKGISYCATCDGAFYKGKNVAIVGGGNTAVEDALYLSNIANKVYVIHRREEFRADQSGLDKLEKKDNVEFLLNCNITKLIGEEKLEKIEVTDNDNNSAEVVIDGLFIAIGRTPETEIFSNLNIDKNGYIIAGEDCKTNEPGIFVAGDVRQKTLRQLVTATNDGAIAATNAISYLNGGN